MFVPPLRLHKLSSQGLQSRMDLAVSAVLLVLITILASLAVKPQIQFLDSLLSMLRTTQRLAELQVPTQLLSTRLSPCVPLLLQGLCQHLLFHLRKTPLTWTLRRKVADKRPLATLCMQRGVTLIQVMVQVRIRRRRRVFATTYTYISSTQANFLHLSAFQTNFCVQLLSDGNQFWECLFIIAFCCSITKRRPAAIDV